jgi:hypothetical protein
VLASQKRAWADGICLFLSLATRRAPQVSEQAAGLRGKEREDINLLTYLPMGTGIQVPEVISQKHPLREGSPLVTTLKSSPGICSLPPRAALSVPGSLLSEGS